MSAEFAFSHLQALAKLRSEARCRVVERAGLLYYAEEGALSWQEADALALEMEATQPALPGMSAPSPTKQGAR